MRIPPNEKNIYNYHCSGPDKKMMKIAKISYFQAKESRQNK